MIQGVPYSYHSINIFFKKFARFLDVEWYSRDEYLVSAFILNRLPKAVTKHYGK